MIASAPQVIAIAGLVIYAVVFLAALSGALVICRAAVMSDELDARAARERRGA